MNIKEKIQTIQAAVSIIAIVVGGFWTYNLFIKERKHYAHANIEQKVSHITLSGRINLLRIDIGLTNTGNSRLILKRSVIRIQQILPILPCAEHEPCAVKEVNIALKETQRREDRFSWPLLSERNQIFEKTIDIEPGEKDVKDFEFIIPSDVKAVRVYSYFRNEQKTTSKDEVGWSISTYYDFEKSNKEVRK